MTELDQLRTYWNVAILQQPYHKRFFRVISKIRQQTDILLVSPEEWRELGLSIVSSIFTYNMKGGGIILRFGDKKLTSAEIPELYLDIQEPDGSGLVRTTFVNGKEDPKAQQIITDIKTTTGVGNAQVGITHNSRNQKQLAFMKGQAVTGHCSFCDLNKMRETAVKESNFWVVKPNDWPYPQHSVHLIFVYKEGHSIDNDPNYISPLAWEETGRLLQWAIWTYGITGGALVMRFLDYKLSGCTMRHLHWQLQAPDDTGPARAWFYKP